MRPYLLVVLVACSYNPPPLPVDGAVDAAPPCEAVSATCVSPTMLSTCATVGEPPVQTTCGWGCDASGMPRCKTVTPSANALIPMDLFHDTFAALNDAELAAGTVI